MEEDPWVDFNDQFNISGKSRDDSDTSGTRSISDEEEQFEEPEFPSEEDSEGKVGTMPLRDGKRDKLKRVQRGRQGRKASPGRNGSPGRKASPGRNGSPKSSHKVLTNEEVVQKRRNRSRSKKSFVAGRRTRSLSVGKEGAEGNQERKTRTIHRRASMEMKPRKPTTEKSPKAPKKLASLHKEKSDKSPKAPKRDKSPSLHREKSKEPKRDKSQKSSRDKSPRGSRDKSSHKKSNMDRSSHKKSNMDRSSHKKSNMDRSSHKKSKTPKKAKSLGDKSPKASRGKSPRRQRDKSPRSSKSSRSKSPKSRSKSPMTSRSKSPRSPRSSRSKSPMASRSKSPRSPRGGARDRSRKKEEEEKTDNNQSIIDKLASCFDEYKPSPEDLPAKESTKKEALLKENLKKENLKKKAQALKLVVPPLPTKSYLSRGTQKRCNLGVAKEIDHRQLNIKASLANLLSDEESVHLVRSDDDNASKGRTRSSSLPRRNGNERSNSPARKPEEPDALGMETEHSPRTSGRRYRRHSIIGASPSDVADRCPNAKNILTRPTSHESLVAKNEGKEVFEST